MNMIDFSIWTKWIAIPVADDTTIGDFIDFKNKMNKTDAMPSLNKKFILC